MSAPICPYCGEASKLVDGQHVYPHRPDLFSKRFFACDPCEAYVGVHVGSEPAKPFGRLANSELRQAKMKAHKAFDPIWKDGLMEREQAYAWLARKMQIPGEDCHIGMFDEKQCNRVVQICRTRMNRHVRRMRNHHGQPLPPWPQRGFDQ